MAARQTINVVVISTADDPDERRDRQTGFQHIGVALSQSLVAQRQSPQPVAFVRIDAGDVEDEIRRNVLKQVGQNVFEPGDIGRVAGSVGQVDIQITGPPAHWKVLFAMHREGEDTRLVFENEGGSIALVDVQIDHQDLSDLAIIDQGSRSDADVVEDAETGAAHGAGVMAAAGRVAGEAMAKGETGRRQRAADGGLLRSTTLRVMGRPMTRSTFGGTRGSSTWRT